MLPSQRLVSILRLLPRRVVLDPNTRLFSDGSAGENPLALVQGASEALYDASKRLEAISQQIQTSQFTLSSGQQVTLQEIVLHSRDAPPADFHAPMARQARTKVLPLAQDMEAQLADLATFYTTIVQPQMQAATQLCRDTPCGGATWEMDTMSCSSGSVQVSANETPCGRLQKASLEFLQQTYDTKQDVVMASRAALILRLAHTTLNAPLSFARKDPTSQKIIAQTFGRECVPTPWIRSDEEYAQLLEIQQELNRDGKASES